MSKGGVLNRNGQRLVPAVYEGLLSSLDVKVALERGFGSLLPAVGADYGAVALVGLEPGAVPNWVVQKDLQPAFLGTYAQMIEHDFLLKNTLARPNTALREHEMTDRRSFERNPFVCRARELGSPINQVMAALLIIEGVGMCGLAIYRDRKRPFSDDDQRLMQDFMPAFGITVSRCQQHSDMILRNEAHEMALGEHRAIVILTSSGREIARTSAATRLFETWFSPAERRGGGVPRPLLEMLKSVVTPRSRSAAARRFWKLSGDHMGVELDLAVKLSRRPSLGGEGTWMLELTEHGHLPPAWAEKLTEAERQVAVGLIRGWSSRLIGDHLGKKHRTVEKQTESIHEKLGIDDVKEIIRRAIMES